MWTCRCEWWTFRSRQEPSASDLDIVDSNEGPPALLTFRLDNAVPTNDWLLLYSLHHDRCTKDVTHYDSEYFHHVCTDKLRDVREMAILTSLILRGIPNSCRFHHPDPDLRLFLSVWWFIGPHSRELRFESRLRTFKSASSSSWRHAWSARSPPQESGFMYYFPDILSRQRALPGSYSRSQTIRFPKNAARLLLVMLLHPPTHNFWQMGTQVRFFYFGMPRGGRGPWVLFTIHSSLARSKVKLGCWSAL